MHRSSAHFHMPRKRFGQHFLHDKNIISKIVDAISPEQDDCMVEIGPGLGALTFAVLPHVKQLFAVELDRDLVPRLEEKSAGKLIIYSADALDFNFGNLTPSPSTLRVIGNLPYNISTPLLFHLLNDIEKIKDMHFMLQREVVERMAANVGSKIYGRLSVMLQYYCDIELLFYVPQTAFTPPPQVESAIVRLSPKTKKSQACDIVLLNEVVKQAFSMRRKTLRNSLKKWLTADDWQSLRISSEMRPEQLTVDDFVIIVNSITAKNKG